MIDKESHSAQMAREKRERELGMPDQSLAPWGSKSDISDAYEARIRELQTQLEESYIEQLEGTVDTDSSRFAMGCNSADLQYHALLYKVMQQPERGDRTGTGTRSLFGYQMRFQNLDRDFPLITTKQVNFKSIVAELLWMLSGDTNVKTLVDQGVNIWNDWPLKHYNQMMLETNIDGADRQITKEQFIHYIKTDPQFAAQWGDVGPCYGHQWRKWHAGYQYMPIQPHSRWSDLHDAYARNLARMADPDAGQASLHAGFFAPMHIDQIKGVIDTLRTNPESRRILNIGWNPADIDGMKVSGLPPCHMMVQFYTREIPIEKQAEQFGIDLNNFNPDGSDDHLLAAGPKRYLDAQVYIRSNDLFLGAPFNIAQYALMIHLFAKTLNMIPGELVYTIGDAHIYSNHYDQVKEQLSRQSAGPLPTLIVEGDVKEDPKDYTADQINLVGYKHHDKIAAPIAV